MNNTSLLSRYAECIYWLARSVERAENLARILEVNETFSRDSRGSQNWLSIVQLYADEKRFFEHHPVATADAVLRFYVLDSENFSSLLATIKNARENARTLRPLISTEMWVHLNVFYNRLRTLTKADLAPANLNRLFSSIKESCQTHAGLVEGTFHRDQGWHFYQLGHYLERADQATRLLDIKYHLLLPKNHDVGSPVDVSQWNALLRSAAGYHAYRRIHAQGITPMRVAGFLLLDPNFPRSVRLAIDELSGTLNVLRRTYGLRNGAEAAEQLDEMQSLLHNLPIESIVGRGLHEFIDGMQRNLINFNNALGRAFFDYAPSPVP